MIYYNLAIVLIITGIVAVMLTGMGTYIMMPVMYDLYNSDNVQNMTGQARQTADTLYEVYTFAPMLFVGGIFLSLYMKATRRQSDEIFE